MQCLAWQHIKAIVQKLGVFARLQALDRLSPAVLYIPEQGMTDVLHVDADLVGAAGFEFAFNQRHRAQPFQNRVVRHRVLAL